MKKTLKKDQILFCFTDEEGGRWVGPCSYLFSCFGGKEDDGKRTLREISVDRRKLFSTVTGTESLETEPSENVIWAVNSRGILNILQLNRRLITKITDKLASELALAYFDQTFSRPLRYREELLTSGVHILRSIKDDAKPVLQLGGLWFPEKVWLDLLGLPKLPAARTTTLERVTGMQLRNFNQSMRRIYSTDKHVFVGRSSAMEGKCINVLAVDIVRALIHDRWQYFLGYELELAVKGFVDKPYILEADARPPLTRRIEDLEKEIKKLESQKRAAAEREEYLMAHNLKERIVLERIKLGEFNAMLREKAPTKHKVFLPKRVMSIPKPPPPLLNGPTSTSSSVPDSKDASNSAKPPDLAPDPDAEPPPKPTKATQDSAEIAGGSESSSPQSDVSADTTETATPKSSIHLSPNHNPQPPPPFKPPRHFTFPRPWNIKQGSHPTRSRTATPLRTSVLPPRHFDRKYFPSSSRRHNAAPPPPPPPTRPTHVLVAPNMPVTRDTPSMRSSTPQSFLNTISAPRHPPPILVSSTPRALHLTSTPTRNFNTPSIRPPSVLPSPVGPPVGPPPSEPPPFGPPPFAPPPSGPPPSGPPPSGPPPPGPPHLQKTSVGRQIRSRRQATIPMHYFHQSQHQPTHPSPHHPSRPTLQPPYMSPQQSPHRPPGWTGGYRTGRRPLRFHPHMPGAQGSRHMYDRGPPPPPRHRWRAPMMGRSPMMAPRGPHDMRFGRSPNGMYPDMIRMRSLPPPNSSGSGTPTSKPPRPHLPPLERPSSPSSSSPQQTPNGPSSGPPALELSTPPPQKRQDPDKSQESKEPQKNPEPQEPKESQKVQKKQRQGQDKKRKMTSLPSAGRPVKREKL